MRALLEGLLPKLFPDLDILCISHDGKRDLEKSLPRKLRSWAVPGDRFVVIHDNDGSDCLLRKAGLAAICANAGRPDTLVRIACQELEAWYIGEPDALAETFSDERLRSIGARATYRDPDSVAKPSIHLARLCPGFQKVSGARALGPQMSYRRNRSRSFRALIEGISRITGRPIPV